MTDTDVYTISRLNAEIAAVLSEGFPASFWLEGEIQGYERDAAKGRQRRWGQVYFELVEKSPGTDSVAASIKTIVWGREHDLIQRRLQAADSSLALGDGINVRIRCALDFYQKTAGLQLKILDVDPDFTLGDLERARRELLEKLKVEGLLEVNKSRRLPHPPLRVGLLTSEGSAAYHDVTEELKRSGYAFAVRVFDARMQGEQTEASVLAGLSALSARADVDVVLLVRGGGSRTDLSWFDKERIARAVAACPKPVITGIGHEIDLSVTDLVSYASLKTPTAAAGWLVEQAALAEQELHDAARRLIELTQAHVRNCRDGLRAAVQSFREAVRWTLEHRRRELTDQRVGLSQNVRRHVAGARRELRGLPAQAARLLRERVRREQEALAAWRRQCELSDPARLLARGYGLLYAESGQLLKSVAGVMENECIEARLRDGRLKARVTAIKRQSRKAQV